MSDLVERLQDEKFWYTPHGKGRPMRHVVAKEAADEIERLLDKIADLSCQVSNGEAEIERLQRDNEGLRNTIKLQAEGKHADVMGMEEIELLRAALERIAEYDVLDPMGYQGEDAYAMADIAREALNGE